MQMLYIAIYLCYTDIDKILKKMFAEFIHALDEAKTRYGDQEIYFQQLQKLI